MSNKFPRTNNQQVQWGDINWYPKKKINSQNMFKANQELDNRTKSVH